MTTPAAPDSWYQLLPQEEREAFRALKCDPNAGLSCQGRIHVAVFFDGIGLNLFDTALPPSNIGRLFKGFPDEPMGTLVRERVYVPGLGTDMNLNKFEFAKTQAGSVAVEAIKSATLGNAQGVAVQAGKDAAIDVLTGRKVRDAVMEQARDLPRDVKQGVTNALRNPGKAGVKVVKDAAGNVARAVLDQIEPVRDSEFMFEAINAGVGPRVERGMQAVKDVVRKSQLQLQELQISVFGCDWGGALARAFLNAIAKECDGDESSNSLQWTLEDKRKIPVRLVFAGLFHSVGYREGNATGFLVGVSPHLGFLSNSAAGKQEVPRATEKAVHFIAANELRWRVHTLGGAQLVRMDASPLDAPARQERIYPGQERDIVGSYPPGFQQREDGLGQVALQEMWRMARLGGVPYDGLEQTKAMAGELGAAFDVPASRTPRHNLRLYDLQLFQRRQAFLGLDNAKAAISDMGGDKRLAEELFLRRMNYVVWLSLLIMRARDHQLPDHLYISAQQAATDFFRVERMVQLGALRRVTLQNQRIYPPNSYQRACVDVTKLNITRLAPATMTVYDSYMHDPVDPPDGRFEADRFPNFPRLLKILEIDDGDDTRQPTFTEKFRRALDDTFKDADFNHPLHMGLPF